MTPYDVRKLADAHGLLASFHNPNTKAVDAVTAPILRALADVVEAAKLNHNHHYTVNGCSTCDALARVEALKP